MKTEKNIFLAFLLNLLFSLFEIVGGIFTNSVAIISDAIHDFGDSISIGIALLLEKKSKKRPDNTYTYGYARYSILGALITNTILVVGSILIIINAIQRIIEPCKINYNGMIIFAIFGVIINTTAVCLTRKGESLNQKSVNLHMLEDVLGWVVVLIGALLIKFTKISIIDPIMSIIVSIFILIHAIKSFKSIIDLFLIKIPNGVEVQHIKKHLLDIKNVIDVHHIHIWSIDGFNNFATMHIVTDEKNINEIKKSVKEVLKNQGICHSTIEIEEIGYQCNEVECNPDKSHIKIHHHNH